MNWLDVLLGGILLLSTGLGFSKGFARIGVGLIATVLAFVLASWFYEPAGDWAIPYTSSRGVANFVGFLTVFVAILIAGAIIGRVLARALKWIGLSWFDRIMGAVLGILRGALIGIVIVLMVSAFLPGDPPAAILDSKIAPVLIEAADVLAVTTPADMKRQFRQTYEKAKRAWVDPLRRKEKKKEE